MLGELIPQGGGDPIPLLKEELVVGRRETCDIILRFSNISSNHCRMFLKDGYWYVKDLDSKNGTRVNGKPITEKRLDPNDILALARHKYQIRYSPEAVGATGPPPSEVPMENLMGRTLMERAGLVRRRKPPEK